MSFYGDKELQNRKAYRNKVDYLWRHRATPDATTVVAAAREMEDPAEPGT